MSSLTILRNRLKKYLEAEAGKLLILLSRKDVRPREIESTLEQFERSWKVYKALEETTSRQWLWPATLVAVCLVTVTLLSTTSRGKFFLVADLETDVVAAALQENWRFDGEIHASGISVYNLDRFEAAGLGLYLESPSRGAFIEALGGQLALENLDLRQFAESESAGQLVVPVRFEIQVQPSKGVQIFFGHCAIVGRLRLDQIMQIRAGDSGQRRVSFQRNKTLAHPEPVEFWGAVRGEVPLQILLSSSETWAFHDLRVRNLHFGREKIREAGAVYFESAIRKGSVYLPEIKRDLKLKPRDRMSIEVVEPERLDVQVGKTLKVQFAGWVRSTLLGPRGFEEELAPTWLEYFYYQEPWAIFWGALAFLWSLGWGLKAVLGR